ncbi:hypothetical protein [Oceanobacillus caeni]|nr:hypothetical protein [Oceanobacillus caeni]
MKEKTTDGSFLYGFIRKLGIRYALANALVALMQIFTVGLRLLAPS